MAESRNDAAAMQLANLFDAYAANKCAAADPSTIVQGDRWRITVLTESLLRLEWSDDGEFTDAPTQMVVCRDFSGVTGRKPQFSVREHGDLLEIETPELLLTYDRKPFSKEGLRVVVRGVPWSQFNTWHYGDDCPGNLLGTARTLDQADGPVKLDTGVLSQDGWAVLDDSASNLIVPASTVCGVDNPYQAWVKPREHKQIDLYFFGYGHRYIEAIRDFYTLTGPQPLLPRFALGNWWSRYYRYRQDEYVQLMDRFAKEGVPLSTAVIDMDWHLTDVDPKYGSGWTGYTWNEELFPDHRAFLRGLKERGLNATLNLHPRDGIRAFEKDYPQVAKEMGVDPASGKTVEFDLTNPRFVQAYFAMHHRMEAEGVRFWWVDWQQGGVTRVPGLDPLWMLNHMHYQDSGRVKSDGRKSWPLTFSRYAGPGSHRYPVGFSGDSVTTWQSLEFQAYFTATASNIGYGWWSHDIGGHMLGVRSNDLEARWYALGIFSPINRLHSTCSPFAGKEPWNFPGETRQAMVKMLRLRAELLPYLYTMNYRAYEQGRPLVEPMYWQSPETAAAYQMREEFRFGSELVVAPIVEPNDAQCARGCANVWLPQGAWFDFFDGRRYVATSNAGRRFEVWRTIDRMPVFAKAGAIVPMQVLQDLHKSVENPRALRVIVFPGADGAFVMREDDGCFERASLGLTADTAMRFVWRDGNGSSQLMIDGVKGDELSVAAVPAERDWQVVFRGVAQANDCVRVLVDGVQLADDAVQLLYDDASLSCQVCLTKVPSTSQVQVIVDGGLAVARDPKLADAFAVLEQAQMKYLGKEMAWDVLCKEDAGVAALGSLSALEYAHDEELQRAEASVDMINAAQTVQDSVEKWRQWRCTLPNSVKRALEEIVTRDC